MPEGQIINLRGKKLRTEYILSTPFESEVATGKHAIKCNCKVNRTLPMHAKVCATALRADRASVQAQGADGVENGDDKFCMYTNCTSHALFQRMTCIPLLASVQCVSLTFFWHYGRVLRGGSCLGNGCGSCRAGGTGGPSACLWVRAEQVGSRGRRCCGERSPDVGFRASVVMEKQREMVEKKRWQDVKDWIRAEDEERRKRGWLWRNPNIHYLY